MSAQATCHLSQYFGHSFVLLVFSQQADALKPLQTLSAGQGVLALKLLRIAAAQAQGASALDTIVDHIGQATQRYTATEGTTVLIRPDGYIAARWPQTDQASIDDYLQHYRTRPAMETAT